nr:penicillin acylase family protein [Candidatus Sigynarchaeota archaeon]
MKRTLYGKFGGSVAGMAVLIIVLTVPLGGLPALGGLLNPIGGIWNGARDAEYPTMTIVSGTGHGGTVYRDALGIPHIFANTYNDLAFIMGYLQAVDRLFSMDCMRKLMAGRISEIMPDPAMIESDKFMRVMGLARSGRELWDKILVDAPFDPELQVIIDGLEAYCAGVNKYIGEITPLRLPFEYKYLGISPDAWTVYDVMTLIKYMTYSLAFDSYDIFMTMVKDATSLAVVNELRPMEPFDFETVVIPDFFNDTSGGTPKAKGAANKDGPISFGKSGLESIAGYMHDLESLIGLFSRTDKICSRDTIVRACSNNWVVNGSLSYSGYPIMCNDPHMPLMLPPIWWEFQFSNITDSGDCVYGVSFPGTPVAQIGHTTSISWGATVTSYDVTDYYYEQFNAAGTKYLFNKTEWRDVESVTEIIKVKGQPDIPLTIKFTRHNWTAQDDFRCPIITDSSIFGSLFSGFANISMKWAGHALDYGIMKGFLRLNKARNINDYMDAMRVYNAPGQNFIFADISGNIALYPKSNYPVRNATGMLKDGRFIMNGSSGEDEWTGYIPFEWIPHKINPSQQYLASNNQRTVNTTEYTRYYLQNVFENSYRARRINQLLKNESTSNKLNSTNITIEKMMAFQTDYYDVAAESFVPFLLDAFNAMHDEGVPNTGATELLNISITALDAWNRSSGRWIMDKALVAPTIFDTWLGHYLLATIGDEFEAAGMSSTMIAAAGDTLVDFLENLTRHDQNSHWFDDVSTTSNTENATTTMLAALNETIGELMSISGNNFTNWTWSNFHVLDVEYLLGAIPAFNIPRRGISGSGRTLNIGVGEPVQAGPSMRFIADLARIANISLYSGYLTVMGGQSGNPASSHYTDNFQIWINNEYHQILFPRGIDAYPAAEIHSTVLFS